MQTFLPYSSFTRSAQALDYKRLGKQRVECKQILKALGAYPEELMTELERPIFGPPKKPVGWTSHPATLMWKGYESALALYHDTVILEWCNQGYKNSMGLIMRQEPVELPHWLGDEQFHASHRSNLLRKDFAYYSQHGWEEPTDLEYIWPEGRQATVIPMRRTM